MNRLRNGDPSSDKLHRGRMLYNHGYIRVADRSRKFSLRGWYSERIAEIYQLSWATTPCCSRVRIYS